MYYTSAETSASKLHVQGGERNYWVPTLCFLFVSPFHIVLCKLYVVVLFYRCSTPVPLQCTGSCTALARPLRVFTSGNSLIDPKIQWNFRNLIGWHPLGVTVNGDWMRNKFTENRSDAISFSPKATYFLFVSWVNVCIRLSPNRNRIRVSIKCLALSFYCVYCLDQSGC